MAGLWVSEKVVQRADLRAGRRAGRRVLLLADERVVQ
jgi:hypothetical protein